MTQIYEENISRIGLPSNGGGLSATISDTFGRCPYFVIIEVSRLEKVITVVNDAQRALGDAGIQAAEFLAGNQVQVVITPQIGSYAWDVLQTTGISIYRSFRGTIQKNVVLFKQGRLNEMKRAKGTSPRMAMCKILHLMNDLR